MSYKDDKFEIGCGIFWDSYTDEFRILLDKYIIYGISQCENVTRKQLTRQFMKKLAKHYGAEIIFNDEPRAG